MSESEKHSMAHWLGVLGFVGLFAIVLSFGRLMTAQSTRSAASPPDNRFAADAAAGGMAEVKLGELAQEKASDPSVIAFGRRMAEDHTKAGEQLQQVARSQNITLPVALNATDQARYDQLSKLSGPEFDHAYMQMMVKDHEKDVAEFQKEASSGKNPAIKDFAAQLLPTLEDHLREARDVAANRKASREGRPIGPAVAVPPGFESLASLMGPWSRRCRLAGPEKYRIDPLEDPGHLS